MENDGEQSERSQAPSLLWWMEVLKTAAFLVVGFLLGHGLVKFFN